MVTKLHLVLLLLLFLTFSFASRIGFCHPLEKEYAYKIEVHVDGSATWIAEERYLLETEDDVNWFQLYMSEFEVWKELQKLSNNTSAMVSWISDNTNRYMKTENFEITVGIFNTTLGSYGIIKKHYDWVGFAKVEDNKRIMIGDVFLGGLYLSRDDALIIEYPSDLVITDVSPEPDHISESDRRLTWYGRRSFGAGEPRVVLEEKTRGIMDNLQQYALVIVGVIAIVGIGSAGFWFFKFRRKEREEVIGQIPRVPLGIEDEEDKVVKLLRGAGGSSYQSTITKRCGFSRSKTSELLKAMENKGMITRKKKGREKLVMLKDTVMKFEKTRKEH